jgi:hypothetical protein
MDSVTEENVDKLFKEYINKEKELEFIQKTNITEMWNKELDILKVEYLKYKEDRYRLMMGETKKKKIIKLKSKIEKSNLLVIED